jgi:hypothetical protein
MRTARRAEFGDTGCGGLRGTLFNRAIKSDHALAERRQLRATDLVAARLRDGHGLDEKLVGGGEQLPRTLVRHRHSAGGSSQGAGQCDRLQQFDLAVAEAAVVEVDSYGQAGAAAATVHVSAAGSRPAATHRTEATG